MTTLGSIVYAFFERHLTAEMGLSPASVRSYRDAAYVNELRPTLLTNVGSPWLQWLLITDAARPSQPARPFGAVQKAARRPCRVANTLIMRQRLAWPGCV